MAFTIPTVFKAVDQMTAPLRKMANNIQGFAAKAEAGISRLDRRLNKLVPSFGQLGREVLAFASTAVLLTFLSSSAKAMSDYEDSIASFRTIVSDLSDKEFKNFESAIGDVAKLTKKSTIDVAASFEKIAGLNAEFAKTSEGISAVSAAAITLSKASRDDLGVSSENLVGIMNQFSLGALEADRTINVLAAGQAVGAASITQTAESFKNFGSVASGANITLEQSVGLIQTLGKFSVFGAEAGTKLRGSVLRLQKANLGYASGQFSINDALEEAQKKMSKFGSEAKKDAFLLQLFGAENISTGKILLNNIDTIGKYTDGVTGTTEAQKAAEINSNTLSNRLSELNNRWITLITTNNQATGALGVFKNLIVFATDNLGAIVAVIGTLVGIFLVLKTVVWASQLALFAYNVALGVTGALSGTASIAIGANTVALNAYKVATAVATAANWLFNASNPIGWIMILISLIAVIIYKWNEWGAALLAVGATVASFFLKFMGPLGIAISLVMSLYNNWEMITSAFKNGGIIAGIKAIGAVILDVLLYPIQQLLELLSFIPGVDIAAGALEDFRGSLGLDVEKPATNPKAQEQDALVSRMESTSKSTVDLNINDPNNRVGVSTKGNMNGINLTSTMGWSN